MSGVSRMPGFPAPPWMQINRHQISSDEAFARRLQEEFDQEVQGHFVHFPSSSQQTVPPAVPAGPSIPRPRSQPHSRHTRTVDRYGLR